MADERILTGEELEEEKGFDLGLRPQRMEEFLGQKKVKENLQIFIRAARNPRRIP